MKVRSNRAFGTQGIGKNMSLAKLLPRQVGRIALTMSACLVLGCSQQPATPTNPVVGSATNSADLSSQQAAPKSGIETKAKTNEGLTHMTEGDQQQGKATFASGCYWCTEAVFQRLDGVENVVSGAMGGHVENPTYEQLCTGTTGHAECIQFEYDPAKVSYETLLEVFWKTHDPTTLNMQGADVGPQYRSAVFYHSEQQRELAEKYKAKLDDAGIFDNPIVTEITEASKFYPAKAQHQNFYNSNPNHGYCGYVIAPKIKKLEAVFADKLKATE